jgi:hypothetical protein
MIRTRLAYLLLAASSAAASARAQITIWDWGDTASSQFGFAVAQVGDLDADSRRDVAIGAPHGQGAQPDSRYVFLISAQTGTVFRVLNGEQTGDLFGASLAGLDDLDGDGIDLGTAYVPPRWLGAGGRARRRVDRQCENSGVSVGLDGANWTERLALLGSATSNGDKLGIAVAIDGDTVIGGANYADTPNGLSGEAYVWDVDPPAVAVYCTAKTNSLGCVPAVGSSGTPVRSGIDPALVAGANAYCQFWSRDPQSPSTTGLSNALRAHIQP